MVTVDEIGMYMAESHSFELGVVLAQLVLQFFLPPFDELLMLGNELRLGLQFFFHCSNFLQLKHEKY